MWSQRRAYILLAILIVTQAASGKDVDLSEGFLTSELHSDSSALREPSTPPNWCPSPFELIGDQCLYFDVITDGHHDECRQVCQSLKGELVAIKTATQMKNIIDELYAKGFDKSFWIDGSDEEEEGNWRFSTGENVPMATPFWLASETLHMPDNARGSENCAHLHPQYLYLINDVSCDNTYSAICEHKLEDTTMEKQPSSIECPMRYIDIGGECLSFLTWEEETWSDARQSCREISGELASMNDIEQLRALYIYVHQKGISSHSFWIGGSDAAEEGNWIWTDGEPVPMGSPWWGMEETGGWHQEPDGGLEENCLAMIAEGLHYFRDKDCSLLLNPLCKLNEEKEDGIQDEE